MCTIKICQQKYDQLIAELKALLNSSCSFLFSAIVYGSYCREEIYSVYSDIDFLCIINKEVLYQKEISVLHDIVTSLYRKYKIKIHLRVRNLSDLYTKESGLFDCGITSSINKLRDGILIYGSSMDSEYLKYIQSVKEEEYVLNLRLRYSNLKYQNRALFSLEENFDNCSQFEDMLQYKCACILFQLAELICYTYGSHFVSSEDALSKAYLKTNNKYFKTAINIKRGKEYVILSHFVATIDELIIKHTQEISPDHLTLLKRIVLQNSGHFDMAGQPIVNSTNIIESSSIRYKSSFISQDGTLHIIRNSKYEYNK